MNSEITLGQLLETLTTSTKVRIVEDYDNIYIGSALHAFDNSSKETLEKTVTSVKAVDENRLIIRV